MLSTRASLYHFLVCAHEGFYYSSGVSLSLSLCIHLLCFKSAGIYEERYGLPFNTSSTIRIYGSCFSHWWDEIWQPSLGCIFQWPFFFNISGRKAKVFYRVKNSTSLAESSYDRYGFLSPVIQVYGFHMRT